MHLRVTRMREDTRLSPRDLGSPASFEFFRRGEPRDEATALPIEHNVIVPCSVALVLF